MSRYLRFRYLVFVPFFVLLFGTWLGGYFLNTTEAHGVVVDASTGQPVKDITVSFGTRQDATDESGSYDLYNLPRDARIAVKPRFSYADQTVSTDTTRVELTPITLNLQVNKKGSGDATASPPVPPLGVDKPEVRQNDKVLGTGTDTGSVVVVPYPVVGSKLLVCAAGYSSTEIEARGIQQTVELEFGGTGCPPLPSPSPSGSPSASPSANHGAIGNR